VRISLSSISGSVLGTRSVYCCTFCRIMSRKSDSVLHFCRRCCSTLVAALWISLHCWSGHLKRWSSSSLSRWHAGHLLLVQNPQRCMFFPTGANLWLIFVNHFLCSCTMSFQELVIAWCWWAVDV
jgi:hypothetical protein